MTTDPTPCGPCYREDHPEVNWTDPANRVTGTEHRCERHQAELAAMLAKLPPMMPSRHSEPRWATLADSVVGNVGATADPTEELLKDIFMDPTVRNATGNATTGEALSPAALTCCPEWCDESEKDDGAAHGRVCPESPVAAMTKAGFATSREAAARQAIEAYRFLVNEGCPPEDAIEQALAEVGEVSVCFAGIGSCGRGWCDHG